MKVNSELEVVLAKREVSHSPFSEVRRATRIPHVENFMSLFLYFSRRHADRDNSHSSHTPTNTSPCTMVLLAV